MYAILETGGRQYWVMPGETLQVEKLPAAVGEEVVFKALWASADAQEGGQPASPTQTAKIIAEVIRQIRGRKVIVFKKRPKSMYRRTHGHRQSLTEIRIKEISLN